MITSLFALINGGGYLALFAVDCGEILLSIRSSPLRVISHDSLSAVDKGVQQKIFV
jgi:hypothetical protein